MRGVVDWLLLFGWFGVLKLDFTLTQAGIELAALPEALFWLLFFSFFLPLFVCFFLCFFLFFSFCLCFDPGSLAGLELAFGSCEVFRGRRGVCLPLVFFSK